MQRVINAFELKIVSFFVINPIVDKITELKIS